jgi:hypothetical protein
MTTALLYYHVSTNVRETKEQVRGNRQYAEENDITVINEYGDYCRCERPSLQCRR